MASKKQNNVNSAENQNTIEYKIEKASEILERNIGFITSCDNKTSIVLTIVGVLFTIILTTDGIDTIYNIICSSISAITFFNLLYLFCFFVSLLILFLGICNLINILIARTYLNPTGIHSSKSISFFSGINKYKDYKTYKKKFYSMSKQELLDDLVSEIYINADIATKKYNHYNRGLKLTIIGFLLFTVFLLIGLYLY